MWYAAVVNESPNASWSRLAAAYDEYIRKASSWPVDDVELPEKTKAEATSSRLRHTRPGCVSGGRILQYALHVLGC